MRNISKMLLAVLLISVTGFASAHSANGSLGKTTTGAAATDAYLVTCYGERILIKLCLLTD